MPSKWRSKPTCNMALAGRRRGTLTGPEATDRTGKILVLKAVVGN